ncbi:MAG TPA: type II toxin-antitoxin system RelE/ParE family toxin [Candidatus Saccharimonadales bacterium]|nr:type II toxin-antitoxin system RelE/ParE family toxin [Candidatus Saccharimonadales bacterium]
MADKIAKLLAKLAKKDLLRLELVINKVATSNYSELDVKVLKGHKDIYRVRVGTYRVIFRVLAKGETEIISIAKRNEKTYKDL